MVPARPNSDLVDAIVKLTSEHDGDVGVARVVACGAAAIPALRAILRNREPSGLYETRRRAVDALAALLAYDSLRTYLAELPDADDPIERAGDDAVINAAARAIGAMGKSADIPLLFGIIKRRPLPGVIDALARFRQRPALPYYIDALGDDIARDAAEKAIGRLGERACEGLVAAALTPKRAGGREISTSIFRRRSVLRLLLRLNPPRETLLRDFVFLLRDPDPWIVFWTAKLWITQLDQPERSQAAMVLLGLLKSADNVLAGEIEECFVAHYELVRAEIDALEKTKFESDAVPIWRSKDHRRRVFERVRRRLSKSRSLGSGRHD